MNPAPPQPDSDKGKRVEPDEIRICDQHSQADLKSWAQDGDCPICTVRSMREYVLRQVDDLEGAVRGAIPRAALEALRELGENDG